MWQDSFQVAAYSGRLQFKHYHDTINVNKWNDKKDALQTLKLVNVFNKKNAENIKKFKITNLL